MVNFREANSYLKGLLWCQAFQMFSYKGWNYRLISPALKALAHYASPQTQACTKVIHK
jgi:hypothetical protein